MSQVTIIAGLFPAAPTLLADPILLGILASLFMEGVKVVDTWLFGTKLQGKASFFISCVVSLAATFYTLYFHYEFFIAGNVLELASQIFAVQQTFYWTVTKFIKEKLLPPKST